MASVGCLCFGACRFAITFPAVVSWYAPENAAAVSESLSWMTDDGSNSLSTLSSLEILRLDDTAVTEAAKIELRDAIPGLRIVSKR